MSGGGAGTARSPEPPLPGRAPAAGGDVDDKFDELAGAVFHHCRNQLSNDADDDESFYPIAEQQQKLKLQQQLSCGCVLSCLVHALSGTGTEVN